MRVGVPPSPPQGLGKTFQTIGLLAYLKFHRGLGGPHLIVAPKSVLPGRAPAQEGGGE